MVHRGRKAVVYTLTIFSVTTCFYFLSDRNSNMKGNNDAEYVHRLDNGDSDYTLEKDANNMENYIAEYADESESRKHFSVAHPANAADGGFQVNMLPTGRLGNIMSQVGSVYGIARKSQRLPVYTIDRKYHHLNIREIFPNLSLWVTLRLPEDQSSRDLPLTKNDLYTNYKTNYSELAKRWDFSSLPKANVTFCCTIHDVTLWLQYKRTIVQMLEFNSSIQHTAKETLEVFKNKTIAKLKTDQSLVYIGLHVRRGDFVQHGIQLLGKEFYFRATNYYRRKYSGNRCIFIVGSNDIGWCKRNLIRKKDTVMYFLQGSAFEDMASLVQCNHTIVGVGSFSRIVGIFTKGEVVSSKKYCWSRKANVSKKVQRKQIEFCENSNDWWPSNWIDLDK